MDSMVWRVISATLIVALVVISPATQAMPVVTSVSHATRAGGSSARMASSTESEMASATLSGCPSVTDSDVNRWRSYMGVNLDDTIAQGGSQLSEQQRFGVLG